MLVPRLRSGSPDSTKRRGKTRDTARPEVKLLPRSLLLAPNPTHAAASYGEHHRGLLLGARTRGCELSPEVSSSTLELKCLRPTAWGHRR